METGIQTSLAGLRGWLLLKKEKYKDDRKRGWKKIDESLATMNKVSANWTNPENKLRLNKILPLIETFRKYQMEVESISYHDQIRANQVLSENAAPTADKILAILDEMVDDQRGLITNDIRKLNKIVDSHNYFLILVAILSIVLITFIGQLLVRGLLTPLDRAVQSTKQIGDINLDMPIKISGPTEIEHFGLALESMRKKLHAHNKALLSLNEELTQFSYRTSHDLKAPLVTIRGLADAAVEDITDKDFDNAKRYCEKIAEQATKLENLVVDILNLAKADILETRNEKVNLSSIIEEVKERLKKLFIDNQVEVLNEVPTSLPKLSLQKVRISQVLENLISNGIKYAHPDRDKKYVKISTNEFDKIFQITVQDNGIGIPEEYKDKVFGMFQRFHPKVSFGSGLGMYIVKKHLDKMKAQIHFESSSEGTVFRIDLPRESV